MTFYKLLSEPPEATRLVELCHNISKTMVWLQLSNSDWIMGGAGHNLVTVYIGAYPEGRHWHAMDNQAEASRDATFAFGDKLGPSSAVARFQRAITLEWQGFNGHNPGRWAKGLTFGTSITPASFVMKALKTGFDAMGGGPMATYSGMRVKDFTVNDVLAYLRRRAAQHNITISRQPDFTELAANEAFRLTEDAARMQDPRKIPMIESARRHGGRFAYVAETAHIPFRRVNAYGFRGDTRDPNAIKNAGGFNPNYSRPDHIAQNVGADQDQALNLDRFLSDANYGGYISVAKSYAIAKEFVRDRGGGWVYACLVEGAFDLPPKGRHRDLVGRKIEVVRDEQELSMPGIIDWDDVMGYRKVDATGKFEGNIWLRTVMQNQDPKAYRTIWDLFSGQSQDGGSA
jgi:hypothetical protein